MVLTAARQSLSVAYLGDANKAAQSGDAATVASLMSTAIGYDTSITTRIGIVQNSIGMEFRWLPAGTFLMGENDEAHQVRLTRAFRMGVYEVTQEQSERVMGTIPSGFKGARNPVEQVSWDDAVESCRKVSAMPEEKAAGRVYRLPTEAEWEYACRARTTTEYCFAEYTFSSFLLSKYCWYSEEETHPLGRKKRNEWGSYDMHGNVWEWCSAWCDDKGAVSDPAGPAKGSDRVLRGGNWYDSRERCRSASRFTFSPSFRDNTLGFPVILSPTDILQ